MAWIADAAHGCARNGGGGGSAGGSAAAGGCCDVCVSSQNQTTTKTPQALIASPTADIPHPAHVQNMLVLAALLVLVVPSPSCLSHPQTTQTTDLGSTSVSV